MCTFITVVNIKIIQSSYIFNIKTNELKMKIHNQSNTTLSYESFNNLIYKI